MAGETFYTYLGGPRTFWGNSGSNIRINNNFCLPSCTPPLMMGGCGCGYNNLRMNSPLSIMAMVNNMMAQTLPYWNFNYTGNTGMTSSSGENTSLDKLTSARQSLNSFGFTKAEGYSLYLDEDNNVVYSYSKDGKEYTASSLAELTSKIAGGSSEGAGNSGATDSTIVASGTAGSSETTGTAEASETDAASAATGDASKVDSADTSSSRTSGNKRKFSRDDVGKNFEWTTYRKLSDATLKQKIDGCRTTVDLMKTLFPDWFGSNKTDDEIKGSKYYKALMNANPTAIDNDGNIVNKHKLDIIVKRVQATTTKTVQQKAREKKLLYEKNGYTTKISVNGRNLGIMASLNNNARLTINSGKLKGSWQIKYGDGDYVDYSDVNWTGWGQYYNARRLYVETRNKYNITSIDCFDSANGTTKTKSIPARYDNNNSDSQGRIEVLIDRKWIPLEDAMRME